MSERRRPQRSKRARNKSRRKPSKRRPSTDIKQRTYRKGPNTVVVTYGSVDGDTFEIVQEMPTKEYETLLKEGR